MIRPATPADLDRLVQLGEMMHCESVFRSIPYSPEKVRARLATLIDGAGAMFVAERRGAVVGGMACTVSEYWFSRELVGTDQVFFIEPGSRNGISALKLIAAMESWCKSMGAREAQLSITSGLNVDKTSQFLELAGYRNAGPIFKKEL